MDIVTYGNQIVARTANGVRQTYEYDKKGQLLAVKDSDGNAVERYVYDKAGNMLRKQILRIGRAGAPRTPQSDDYITTTFTFDGANQLVSSTTDGVTTKYAYDAAGRLVREGTKTYRYGYLDKVLSVTDGKDKYTYTYHVDGQLARATYVTGGSQSPATENEDFEWDGLALVKRGGERFINEPHIGGGNPVVSSKGTSYFNDVLGTTLGSKTKGTKYSAAALTAFGESLPTDSSNSQLPTHNSQTFYTGKPLVAGLGHAFLFRNYRAGLGKWQTADPMAYIDGWNRLTYCGNEVAIAVDLWGCHTVKVGEVVFDMRVILPDDFTRAEELHLADVWLECNHNYDNPHATLDAYTKSGLFYATIYVKDDITYTFKYSLTPESRVTGYPEVDYETKAVEYQWAVKIVITAKKKITTEGGGVVTSEAHFTYSTELTNERHLIRRTHE